MTLKERADTANAKKYSMVSKYLAAHLDQDVSYGAAACKKRIEELKEALVVTEIEINEDDGSAVEAATQLMAPAEVKARLKKEIATDKVKLAKKQEKLDRLCGLEQQPTTTKGTKAREACNEIPETSTLTGTPDQISQHRVRLLVRELEDLCTARKLVRGGSNKAELVRRLAADDASRTAVDLQKALRDAKLPTHGSRRELLYRGIAHEVNTSLLRRGISRNHHDFMPDELPASDLFPFPTSLKTLPPRPRNPTPRTAKRGPLDIGKDLEYNPPKRTRQQHSLSDVAHRDGDSVVSRQQSSFRVRFAETNDIVVDTHSRVAQNVAEHPSSYEDALIKDMRQPFANFGRQAEKE